ncbi:MAG: DUF3616 domain-containing protein [Acidobacteriota bacterium]
MRYCNHCGDDLMAGDTSPLAERVEAAVLDPARPAPALIGFRLTGEKKEYRLDRNEIAIGKAAHNQIVLDDPTVSASHAIVSLRDGIYSILDLASRNGTWVNGERLSNRSHPLQHGDRIQIGQIVLTFRVPEQGPAAAAKVSTLPLQPVERAPLRSGAPPPGETITINLPREVQRAMARESLPPPARRRPPSYRSDSRMKAALVNSASRIISTLIGTSLTIALALFLARQVQPPEVITPGIPAARAVSIAAAGSWIDFQTGSLGVKFEASGAASRPGATGANGLLLLSDRGADPLFWMALDDEGSQRGPLQAIPIPTLPGDEFSDPEALTYGNSYYYLLGSQSDPIDPRQHRLVRFDFDPAKREVRGLVESIGNLRDLLLNGIPEIALTGARPGSVGGLNAEGLAWDPNHERLLIGLRSPLIGDQAILVPLKMRDPRGPFDQTNIELIEPRLIILPLDGQGVRDLTYDPILKSFLILSGPPENRPEDNFNIWEWNGQKDGHPRRLLTLDGQRRPEGIASLSINGRNTLFITGDTGSYVALGYRFE